MDAADYARLRRIAVRFARGRDEADDLLQETLRIGVEAGRYELPWLVGAMRRQAAMRARTAVRRRARERQWQGDAATVEPVAASDACAASRLPPMPRAARVVAVLALHGLGAEEIRSILGLAPTAFRQRLTVIRRHFGALSPALRAESLALAYVRDPARAADLQYGLVRRALVAALDRRPGLGTHDHDGHLLVLHRRAHTPAPGGN